jgi:hypothetical protein
VFPLIDALPFFAHPMTFDVGSGQISIPALAPFVWVSLSRPSAAAPTGVSFPAVIDTGCSSALIIREEHLALLGTPRATFPVFPGPLAPGTTSAGGTVFRPRVQAKLWLDASPLKVLAPLDLEINCGVSVHLSTPGEREVPPLLGARAFRETGLAVSVDYRQLRTTIGVS